MAEVSHAVKAAEMCRTARHKAPFPDLPGSTGDGKAELGVACPLVLICPRACTELPAPGCLQQGVSNASTRGTASRSTVTPSESHRSRTGRIHRMGTNHPQSALHNKDTQCPGGTLSEGCSQSSAHTRKETLVKQKCSSISGPGQLFPGRTGKPKSCQQL